MVVNEFGYEVYEGDRAYYEIVDRIPLGSNPGEECSYLVITKGGGRIQIDPPFAVNVPYAKGVALRDEMYPGQLGGSKDQINSYWVPVFYSSSDVKRVKNGKQQ